MINLMTKSTRKIPNNILANPAATPTMPPKLTIAAITAMIRKPMAHLNTILTLSCS